MLLIKSKPVKVGENKYFTVISTCYLKGDDDKMEKTPQEGGIPKRGLRKGGLKPAIFKHKRRPRT